MKTNPSTQPAAPRTIGILGISISSGNRGVLALGASLVELCCRTDENTGVVLLTGLRHNRPASFLINGRECLIPVVNYRLSPHSRLRDHLGWIVLMAVLYRLLPPLRRSIARAVPWIGTVAAADLVGDIRGGDSFSDIYGLRRFLLGFLTAWTVLLVRGDLVQFPQTFGPYNSALARSLARYLLKRASVILARDKQSQQVAQALAGPGKTVLLSPDVAFALAAVRPPRLELLPPCDGPVPSGTVGLNVNGLMYNGGYTRHNMFGLAMDYRAFLRDLACALLAEHPGELWLIPHTIAPPGDVESDNESSETLRESLPPDLQRRVRVIAADYDPHEIKWIIGQCEFFIGSRMHACIAALSQGVPCAGVAYSMKFAGVFETVGMADSVIDARTSDSAAAIGRIMARYRGRVETRAVLPRRADEARSRLSAVFACLAGASAPECGYPALCNEPVAKAEVTIRVAQPEDVPALAAIYRSAFPRHTRSLAGQRVCESYFAAAMSSRAYRVLVAGDAGHVYGLAVLHLDQNVDLGRRWMFRRPLSLLWGAARHPLTVARGLRTVLSAGIRQLRMPQRQVPPSAATAEGLTPAHLDIIAVDSRARGKHIGQTLMDDCMQLARTQGRPSVTLAVQADNDGAWRLYERCGFRRTALDAQSHSYFYRAAL